MPSCRAAGWMTFRSVPVVCVALLIWASPAVTGALPGTSPDAYTSDMLVARVGDTLHWTPPAGLAVDPDELMYGVYGLTGKGGKVLLGTVPSGVLSYRIPDGFPGYGVAPIMSGVSGEVRGACIEVHPTVPPNVGVCGVVVLEGLVVQGPGRVVFVLT